MLDQVVDAVLSNEDLLIVSHIRPDGDSIGSQFALALALESLNKKISLISHDPVPSRFEALPGSEYVRVGDRLERGFDAAFVLECGNLARPGIDGLAGQFIVNVDHHHSTEPFGAINWIDPNACAVGEMIYHLLRALDVTITPEIATNIYVAILTDTGSFQFSSTTSDTFRIAAELADCGADVSKIAMRTFYANPVDKVRKMGIILNAMELDSDGRIVTTTLTRSDMAAHGVDPNATDIEGLINYPMTIQGIEVAILLQELDDGSFRISLRSKNDVDVSSVATSFGGGGHRKAAGCQMSGTIEGVREQVLESVRKVLDAPTSDSV
jgi:phosphoesterase RecJ-like protein